MVGLCSAGRIYSHRYRTATKTGQTEQMPLQQAKTDIEELGFVVSYQSKAEI